MCTKVICKKCNRPTWRGCGAHVEQVLGDIPQDKRCQCNSSAPTEKQRKPWWSR